jgi:hypothetical protein
MGLAGVVLAAAVLVTGCGDTEDDVAKDGASSGSVKEDRKAETPAASKDVKIVRSGFEDSQVWGPHAFVTHYEITNHGKDAANYFVGLEFLDGDGDVLGSTGVTADKLGPGKTNTGDTAPVKAEITNGPMKSIKSVRVSSVDRTAPE